MDHLRFLGKLVDELIGLSQQLEFNNQYAIDLRCAMNYATLVELSHSVHTMLSNDAPTGIRILMRSALEAYVDLINLLNDPEYFANLEAQNHKEWLRLFKAADGGNEFVKAMAEHPKFREQYDLARKQLAKLQEDGKHPLRIDQKFNLAGLEEVYQSVYVMMCSEAHNNQTGLVSRHVDIVDGNVELHFRKEEEINHHVSVLDSLSGLLVNASNAIHAKYGEGENTLNALSDELSALREKWLEDERQS